MIENARVLQPEFLPSEVRHRAEKINYLSAALNPITRGEQAESAILSGPSGVGKTCVSKFTVQQLREEVLDIEYQYVNCWESTTRFRTLYSLLDGIGATIDIHRQSTPTDVLLDRLRDYDGPPYVAILDECDQLEDKDLLYELYRIPNLTLLIVSNREEELFAPLDSRISSRLAGCERIRFSPYSHDELLSILRDRVEWGLSPGVIDENELDLVANAAVGDARVAICILRLAARIARRNDRTEITEDVIEEVIPEAKEEVKQKNAEKLSAHQQVLYDIIQDRGEIRAGPLYDEYANRVTDPKTKRTLRNYLSKMEHYNLVTAEGATKSRRYKLRT